ncbi:hypothetical protein ADUPG1_006662 [Aduncisulcus paluster]|uniref:Uncharacterized protein n=1 Tax=Aduncisulcus paluster TaxID=2918883 RepID=A0ABQ5KJ31_9EUKA|nr:hypothetical protein ADUPG1_006662 [Aduncisulcus paluster]
MTLELTIGSETVSLTTDDFLSFNNQECNVRPEDMRVIENRGIEEDDMETYFYYFSEFENPIYQEVEYGTDATINVFRDSTSSISIAKSYFKISLDPISEGCSENEIECSPFCLSMMYPKTLKIGITPGYLFHYNFSISKNNVLFDDWAHLSTESFSCSVVNSIPIDELSIFLYDTKNNCGLYETTYGGSFGDNYIIGVVFCFLFFGLATLCLIYCICICIYTKCETSGKCDECSLFFLEWRERREKQREIEMARYDRFEPPIMHPPTSMVESSIRVDPEQLGGSLLDSSYRMKPTEEELLALQAIDGFDMDTMKSFLEKIF